MNESQITPVLIERASEQLRQERETFEQRKKQEERWFGLRLIMGYSSILLLGAIMIIATYILISHEKFPTGVVTSAGAALFMDVLGLLIGVWRIALNPGSVTKLEPVTDVELSEVEVAQVAKESTGSLAQK